MEKYTFKIDENAVCEKKHTIPIPDECFHWDDDEECEDLCPLCEPYGVNVNEKKRCVTVFQYGHDFDGIDLIMKRYPWADEKWLFSKEQFQLPEKITATAKCHKEDEFDPEAGEMIAMKKLNRIIRRKKEQVVEAFERYIARQMANPAAKSKAYLEEKRARKEAHHEEI